MESVLVSMRRCSFQCKLDTRTILNVGIHNCPSSYVFLSGRSVLLLPERRDRTGVPYSVSLIMVIIKCTLLFQKILYIEVRAR